MIPEYLYRFDDVKYASLDEFDNITRPTVQVQQRRFKVISETPCGYWINLFESFDDKKWVSKTAKKRYAYPTIEEARISFKARKLRQLQILETQISQVKQAIALIPKE